MGIGVILVLALICGAITAKIFEGKGRSTGRGFALGFLLGLIGLIISLFLSDKSEEHDPATAQRSLYRECPSCKESMRRDASVCPHCRSTSTPWQWDGRRWWHEGASGRYWLDEARAEWVKEDSPRTLDDIDTPRAPLALNGFKTGTETEVHE
jgi:uncharacterized membrane protein YeaQ/YmgE (transglycosylase-associated protein family)